MYPFNSKGETDPLNNHLNVMYKHESLIAINGFRISSPPQLSDVEVFLLIGISRPERGTYRYDVKDETLLAKIIQIRGVEQCICVM